MVRPYQFNKDCHLDFNLNVFNPLLTPQTYSDVCKERAGARKGHATLDPEKAAEVIDDFAKNLVAPETFEGWSKVFHVTNSDDVKSAMQELKTYPVKLK